MENFRGLPPTKAHARATEEMEGIVVELHDYARRNGGRYLDGLVDIGRHKLLDPFSGQPYWYAPRADRMGFELACMGEDQAIGGTGTDGDIRFTERGLEE